MPRYKLGVITGAMSDVLAMIEVGSQHLAKIGNRRLRSVKAMAWIALLAIPGLAQLSFAHC